MMTLVSFEVVSSVDGAKDYVDHGSPWAVKVRQEPTVRLVFPSRYPGSVSVVFDIAVSVFVEFS